MPSKPTPRGWMPALLTRMSMPPNRPRVAWNIAAISSSLETSTSMKSRSSGPGRRSATMTRAPALRKRCVMALPMPEEPPVTMAHFPMRENGVSTLAPAMKVCGSAMIVPANQGRWLGAPEPSWVGHEAADSGRNIPMKQPYRHFQVTEPSGLPAACIEASLDGGANLHVFHVKIDELLCGLLADGLESFTGDILWNHSGGEELQAVGAQGLDAVPDDAVRRSGEEEGGMNEEEAPFDCCCALKPGAAGGSRRSRPFPQMQGIRPGLSLYMADGNGRSGSAPAPSRCRGRA